MEKPLLATNIDGFLIDHSAFIEPHRIWFDRIILLTKDEGFNKWKGHPNYFQGVNESMEKIMPDASKEERTKKARDWYQEDVAHYIQIHPEVVNQKLTKVLKRLKEKFTLALITTNTEEHINKILKASNLYGIYDIIHASSSEEEPNKAKVFEKFNEKYGKPKYYIASRSKEAFEICKKFGIVCIYFCPDRIDVDIQSIADKIITKIGELAVLD